MSLSHYVFFISLQFLFQIVDKKFELLMLLNKNIAFNFFVINLR